MGGLSPHTAPVLIIHMDATLSGLLVAVALGQCATSCIVVVLVKVASVVSQHCHHNDRVPLVKH